MLSDILGDQPPLLGEHTFYRRILQQMVRIFDGSRAVLVLRNLERSDEILAGYPEAGVAGCLSDCPPEVSDRWPGNERSYSLDRDGAVFRLSFSWPIGPSSRLVLFLVGRENGADLTWDGEKLRRFSDRLGRVLVDRYTGFRIFQAKEHLEALFDHLPVAVCVIREDFIIERVNLAFSRLFGCVFQELVGRKCYRIICERPRPGLDCPLSKVQRSAEPAFYQLKGHHPHRVSVLPMVGNGARNRSLHLIYNDSVEQQTVQALWLAFFNDLYNRLSQPLTALSLRAEMLMAGATEPCSEDFISLHQGIVDVIQILRRERTTLLQGLKPDLER